MVICLFQVCLGLECKMICITMVNNVFLRIILAMCQKWAVWHGVCQQSWPVNMHWLKKSKCWRELWCLGNFYFRAGPAVRYPVPSDQELYGKAAELLIGKVVQSTSLDCTENRWSFLLSISLLMEEILHKVDMVHILLFTFYYLRQVLYIPSGAGFLPSTVCQTVLCCSYLSYFLDHHCRIIMAFKKYLG